MGTMSDPCIWPAVQVHPKIVKAGIRQYFALPLPLQLNHQRADSVGLFYRLVSECDLESLEMKMCQFVETYSHWMYTVDRLLKEETKIMCIQMRLDKMLYSNFGSAYRGLRPVLAHQDVEDVRKQSEKADRQYDSNRKKLEIAMAEMDRIGPVITMLFRHLIAVRAGDANPIEDEVVSSTPGTPLVPVE